MAFIFKSFVILQILCIFKFLLLYRNSKDFPFSLPFPQKKALFLDYKVILQLKIALPSQQPPPPFPLFLVLPGTHRAFKYRLEYLPAADPALKEQSVICEGIIFLLLLATSEEKDPGTVEVISYFEFYDLI